MAVGDVLKLQLESITLAGDALGRFEGKSIFVEGGAPDELVLCRITEEQKNWSRAELLEIIKESPFRIKSNCAFYGKCGGCNLQHIDYKTQLDIKVSLLKNSFLRTGFKSIPEPEVFPSLPWEYRNRMQFHRSGFKPGLMGRGGGEIIAISDCPVAVPKIREALGKEGISLPPEKERFTVFAKDDVFLYEGGHQRGKINLLDKKITLDSCVFFQSNCFMLENLILELQKIAATAEKNMPMADLYCGVGTFALFLGELFPGIILAEENKNALSIARENLKCLSNGIKAEYFALRDTMWQGTFLRPKKEISFAVVDPPRAGLNNKIASVLAHRGPSVLAYVSCNAVSLAFDSAILVNGGYKLIKISFFDFYPQTEHIESLAVFVK
jgi:23S rRNA (uracil1939-C5)-methyltransferase